MCDWQSLHDACEPLGGSHKVSTQHGVESVTVPCTDTVMPILLECSSSALGNTLADCLVVAMCRSTVPGTSCCLLQSQLDGQPYSALRAHVRFNMVTDLVWRDTLFNATREQMCRGGYSKTVYANVAALMSGANLKVMHNSKHAHIACIPIH